MGEVEYERAMYIQKNEDGTQSAVFLLDEKMGMGGRGAMSGILSELIAKAVCVGTYRNAAQSISEMTGQSISHAAAWNVTQKLGQQAEESAQEAARLAERNEGRGTAEAAMLFEEQDGIWLHLQGESRKAHGKAKEMKVAIAYDGAEKESEGRYRLTGKVAAASIEPAAAFDKRREGVIAANYNVDEIKMRVMNGDGAAWIQTGEDEETVYQLDPYHRNKAIVEAVPDKTVREKIFQLLYAKRIDALLGYIDALANSAEDETVAKKLRELWGYFNNNKDGLIAWNRRELDVPAPPEGKEYRRLGAMESNIYTIIGNRMKGGRACWSIDGANNLAGLLALRYTDRLTLFLNGITSWRLPEKYAETTVVKATAAKVPAHAGRGYEPPRGGAAPATPEYKFVRDIGRGGNVLR